jgi:hypothetical protein
VKGRSARGRKEVKAVRETIFESIKRRQNVW